jgi:anthranilate synthase component 1
LSFDIAGDLDTPVSAFAKLKPFEPRFLLESVEGGERLGRYSFIGFGDALEVKLDTTGFRIGQELRPIPDGRESLLDGLRSALKLVPVPTSGVGVSPLSGGLVGFTAYDVVRYFDRCDAKLSRRCAARCLASSPSGAFRCPIPPWHARIT